MRGSLFILALASVAISACSGLVTGNGIIKTETRQLPAFSSVRVDASGLLKIDRGPARVEITTDANLLGYLDTAVRGGELSIGFKPGSQVARISKLVFDVTLPELSGVTSSGSAVTTIDAFDGRSFLGRSSGSGELRGELRYDRARIIASGSGLLRLHGGFGRLDLELSGSGRTELSGSARELGLVVTGSGSVDGKDLSALSAQVGARGSSRIELRVRDSLVADLSGSGSLVYWGKPALETRLGAAAGIRNEGD